MCVSLFRRDDNNKCAHIAQRPHRPVRFEYIHIYFRCVHNRIKIHLNVSHNWLFVGRRKGTQKNDLCVCLDDVKWPTKIHTKSNGMHNKNDRFKRSMDLDTVAFNDWMPFLFVATTMWAPEPRSMLGVNASSHWHCDGDLFLFLPRWGSRDFLFVSRIKLPAQIVFVFFFVVSIYSLLFAAMTGGDTLFCALSLSVSFFILGAVNVSHAGRFAFIYFYLFAVSVLFSILRTVRSGAFKCHRALWCCGRVVTETKYCNTHTHTQSSSWPRTQSTREHLSTHICALFRPEIEKNITVNGVCWIECSDVVFVLLVFVSFFYYYFMLKWPVQRCISFRSVFWTLQPLHCCPSHTTEWYKE